MRTPLTCRHPLVGSGNGGVIVGLLMWVGVSGAPIPMEADSLADHFQNLSRESRWRKVDEVPLGFKTFHPQGLSKVGDCWYLSSVEIVNREEGRGVGHLFEIGADGKLRRELRLGEGKIYHPGGLDYDGRHLWVPVAEYRPGSESILYQVDPELMQAQAIFRFSDHIGAVVVDPVHGWLVGVSWGSRRFYRWELGAGLERPTDVAAPYQRLNGSHYVDYQDGQHVAGTALAIFGGLATYSSASSDGEGVGTLGGLELIDLRDLRPVHQMPLTLRSPGGRCMLQNPWWVECVDGRLRFYFIPDDENSTLWGYEAE